MNTSLNKNLGKVLDPPRLFDRAQHNPLLKSVQMALDGYRAKIYCKWRIVCLFVTVLLLDVTVADILPLLPLVPPVPERGDTEVQSDAEGESACEDGGREDTVAPCDGVVEEVGKAHGLRLDETVESL